MPGYERAELTAELTVNPAPEGTNSPEEQVAAARRAAAGSGLAREAGPETVVLAGGRREVLAALTATMEAAVDAGARGVEVRVEAERDAARFDGA